MFSPIQARRWRARSAVLALCVLAVPLACGNSSSDSAADEGVDGSSGAGWSYTDSTGATIELDSPPRTVVAETTIAGGLWELGVVADGTFGELRSPDGSASVSIGLADPDDFNSLGEAYGQINLEQLAALAPDVIIAPTWKEGAYWGIEDEMLDKVKAIAPIIGVSVTGRPIDEVLAEVDELAQALGADVGSDKVTDARKSFAEASERLRAATQANPGVRVMAASGTPDIFYVAVPSGYPDLSYFESLGVEMVNPDTDDPLWHGLSWEEVGRYPADVVLGDARGGDPDAIRAQLPPNALELPAIAQGQLGTWQIPLALGYGVVADVIDELAQVISTAKAGIA